MLHDSSFFSYIPRFAPGEQQQVVPEHENKRHTPCPISIVANEQHVRVLSQQLHTQHCPTNHNTLQFADQQGQRNEDTCPKHHLWLSFCKLHYAILSRPEVNSFGGNLVQAVYLLNSCLKQLSDLAIQLSAPSSLFYCCLLPLACSGFWYRSVSHLISEQCILVL